VLEAAPEAPRAFVLTADDVDLLGEGALALEAVLVGGEVESGALPIDVTLARDLMPALTRITTGPVTFNERATVDAAGLLFAGEGRSVAHFRGDFRASVGGAAVPIDVALPVVPESPTTRARGVVVLTTDLAAGLRTGDFDGEVALETTLAGGALRTSENLPAAYAFGPPLALGFEPGSCSTCGVPVFSEARSGPTRRRCCAWRGRSRPRAGWRGRLVRSSSCPRSSQGTGCGCRSRPPCGMVSSSRRSSACGAGR
jgi:hypothetical protein